MANYGGQAKTHICPYCGKLFQPLGIASHRASCYRKYVNTKIKELAENCEYRDGEYCKHGSGAYCHHCWPEECEEIKKIF